MSNTDQKPERDSVIKKTIDQKAAEMTDRYMKDYILDGTKMQGMYNSVMMLMGPMEPFEVNAWIFALEQIVSGLKQTPAYSADIVALLGEVHKTAHTSYTGTPKQCRDMIEKLTREKEAAE